MTDRFNISIVVLTLLILNIDAICQPSSISVSPKSGQVRVDSVITLIVQIGTVQNLHGYSVTLGFDAALFRCKAARKGSFLSSTVFLSKIDSLTGQVTLDEAILGQSTKSGSGNLAEVDLRPKQSGTSPIDILKADLRDQANQTISATTTGGSVSITPIGSNQQTVAVQIGWNLISLPLRPQDSTIIACFPSAQSSAFRFDNGYVSAPTLSCGTGYWLKFAASTSATISGVVPTSRTFAVREGWNMIGPGEQEINVSSITTTPASIILSNYFGYNSGYYTTATLVPGHGFWVRTSQAGVISFPSGSAKVLPPVTESEGDLITIEFADAKDAHGTLKLNRGTVLGDHELPPLPPTGIFDVRFESGWYLESLGGTDHAVRLQSVGYPMRVRARNLKGAILGLRYGVGEGKTDAMIEEGRDAVIESPVDVLYIRAVEQGGEVVGAFALRQNYPNPFNGISNLGFWILNRSYLTLKVYDLLGREVAVLVNEAKQQGNYTVTFDAGSLASGVYVYRLQVGDQVASRRMLLMR
jgi:hypothetical protein